MSSEQIHVGVVLMNLGGPTSSEAVKPFLYNLFSDTDIIKLGGGRIQERLARSISKHRSPKVAAIYEKINGCPKGCMGSKYCPNRNRHAVSDACSPINSLTEAQRRALEKNLNAEHSDVAFTVYTAMRYWIPFTETIINEMREDGITHTVFLPLYPHFSWTTTGSSFRDWEQVKKKQQAEGKSFPWTEYHIRNYHLNEWYVKAVNERIDAALASLENDDRMRTHLVFSAHGTPLSEVRSGDPYTREIAETVKAVMAQRTDAEEYWLGFQSRVGLAKWTQPNTAELMKRLCSYGIKNFVMIPIAFVTDHIETFYELNIELREDLEQEGYEVENLVVTEGLNDHPYFIRALSEEVSRQIGHMLPQPQNNVDIDSVS